MLYKRSVQTEIKKWLHEEQIIFINGQRQVGKTSLLYLLQKDLENQKISKDRILHLNLEDFDVLRELNNSPKNLLSFLKSEEKNFVFLDEIQLLDNPSNFLKYIYDEYRKKIKIITTGSANLEIKAKMQDSLVGRKISFFIKPLNFFEFINFKKFKNLEYLKKDNIPNVIKKELKKLLDEYLIFGGLPEVVLQTNFEKKKKLLHEYVNTYINKDIRVWGKMENIQPFNNLLKILSVQIGNLINVNELSNTLKTHRKEIEKNIFLLENTFVTKKILPFYKNLRSQITKSSKIYFGDLGIRNMLIHNFNFPSERSDNGALFENFIFLELQKINNSNLFFYRTVNKTEIDFILEKNAQIYPIEVKYKNLSKNIDERTLHNFIKKIKEAKGAFVVNLDFNQKGKIFYYDFLKFLNET